jgi:hypothetical protein
MGQELECRMRIGGRSVSGRAYLETDHLLFRGEERRKILFKNLKGVKASGGVLLLEFEGGPAELELGRAAEKWADKILHPPSRASKLGIKSNLTARAEGDFPADFLQELDGLPRASAKQKADLIFLMAPQRKSLDRVAKLATALTPTGALWVVYPKGVPEIREIEVLEAGRAAGLTDVKVVSFSPSHTALRFVIPARKREKAP